MISTRGVLSWVGLCAVIACANAGAAAAATAPGDPDPTFDGDGRAVLGFDQWPNAEGDSAFAFGQSRILAAGGLSRSGPDERAFAVARLDGAGAVQSRTVVPVDGMKSVTRAARYGGGVVVGGETDTDGVVARFGPDGQLDDGFGDHGIVKTLLSTLMSDATVDVTRVTVQDTPSGPMILLVAGWYRLVDCGDEGCHYESGFLVARYDGSGHLDDSFGDHGVVRHGPVAVNHCGTLIPTDAVGVAAGDLVVASIWSARDEDPSNGCGYPFAPPIDTYLSRLDAGNDYSEDPNFPDRMIDERDADVTNTRDIDVDSLGRIVTAGFERYFDRATGQEADAAFVARFDAASGDFDGSFNGGAVRKLSFPGTFEPTAVGVGEDPAGHIATAVALTVRNNSQPFFEYPGFGAVRLDASGAPDSTFGPNGTVTVDFSSPAVATGLDVAGQQLLLAGTAGGPNANQEFALARLGPAPPLDPGPASGESPPRDGERSGPTGFPTTASQTSGSQAPPKFAAADFGAHALAMGWGRWVPVQIHNGNALTMTGRLTISGVPHGDTAARRKVLGAVKFNIPSGKTRHVHVRIARSWRRQLHLRGKLRVRLTMTSAVSGTAPAIVRRAVTLRFRP